MYELIAEPLGAGALSRAVLEGKLPADWGVRRVTGPDAWARRAGEAKSSSDGKWLDELHGAFGASGAALERLTAAANGRGAVVTTGQQPGLFGGPLYTWYKAITALALADEIQNVSGIPVAPVFWAATDDSDFAEASWTGVAMRGGARMLRMRAEPPDGAPLARAPLGDISVEMKLLREAAGTASDSPILDVVERAWSSGSTVGQAYVSLLRAILEPMGVAVLDASHPALRRRGAPLLRKALTNCEGVATSIARRDDAIRGLGMEPQVNQVAGLSLVFVEENGVRRRVSLAEGAAIEQGAASETLSANVLLRPVLERFLLPTVAYAGGPSEIAYFAQATAVAQALGVDAPAVVPRWSGTIVESHVQRILEKYSVTASELANPHEVWSRLARSEVPADVLRSLADLKDFTDSAFTRMAASLADGGKPVVESPRIVEGARVGLLHKIARFERRIVAAVKRRDTRLADDIATARGALYPLGRRQERALNIVPLLARYGSALLDDIRARAATHAGNIVRGDDPAFAKAAGQGVGALTAGD